MSDLTDFLRARITEDEAVAQDPNAEGCPHALGCEVNSYNAGDCDCTWPAQVLAECEAKRRIVDNATNMHTSGPEWDEAVRILAAIYADHPDYREEWRP